MRKQRIEGDLFKFENISSSQSLFFLVLSLLLLLEGTRHNFTQFTQICSFLSLSTELSFHSLPPGTGFFSFSLYHFIHNLHLIVMPQLVAPLPIIFLVICICALLTDTILFLIFIWVSPYYFSPFLSLFFSLKVLVFKFVLVEYFQGTYGVISCCWISLFFRFRSLFSF